MSAGSLHTRASLMAVCLLAAVGCQSTTGLDSRYIQSNGIPAGTKLKADTGGCHSDIEDFENWVSGNDECFAIKIYRSRKVFQSSPTLVIAVHGDGAYGAAADDAPQKWIDQIETHIIPESAFKTSDTIIVAIARSGYPIENVGRSTGYRPEPNGRRATYQPSYAKAIMAAVKRLSDTHNVARVVGWGSSGGSATLAIGAALPSAFEFSDLLLGVCPCDVPTWENSHGWVNVNAQSPLDIAAKIPGQTNVILVVGNQDRNTHASLSERFLEVRKAANRPVSIVYTDGTHSTTRDTPEHIRAQLGTIVNGR